MKLLFLLSLFPFLIQAQEYNATITFSPFVQMGVSVPRGNEGMFKPLSLFTSQDNNFRSGDIHLTFSSKPTWHTRQSHAFGLILSIFEEKDLPANDHEFLSDFSFEFSLQRFDVGQGHHRFNNGIEYNSMMNLTDWRLNLNAGMIFGDKIRVRPHFGVSISLSREITASLSETDQNGNTIHYTPDKSQFSEGDSNLMAGVSTGYFHRYFSVEIIYALNRILTQRNYSFIDWTSSRGEVKGKGTWLNTFSLRVSYNIIVHQKKPPNP